MEAHLSDPKSSAICLYTDCAWQLQLHQHARKHQSHHPKSHSTLRPTLFRYIVRHRRIGGRTRSGGGSARA